MMASIGRRLLVLTLLLVFLSYQRLYHLLLPYYDYFYDDRLVDISIIETPASSKRTLRLTEKNGQDIMMQNQQQQQQHSPHKCQVEHDFFPQELIQNISNSSTFCHPTFRRNKYKCKCSNPILPHSRESDPSWIRTIEKNVNLTNNYFMGSSSSSFSNSNNNSTTKKNLNVVFLGDSITRGWHWDETKQKIFHRHFGNDSLALGVARDTTSNLLHRIRDNSTNGELTSILNNPPKVWWILIGINNLGTSTLCSREATLAGILQIVADLRNLSQPTNQQQQQQQQQQLTSDVGDGGNRSGYNNVDNGPIIVLNSILPKSKFPNGRVGDDWKKRVPWINRRLECFAEMTPGVEYFDSTDLFLMKSNHKRIDLKLLPDKVHPSTRGYEVWGKSISKKLSQLL